MPSRRCPYGPAQEQPPRAWMPNRSLRTATTKLWCNRQRRLHHNFVVAVLNDLLGIDQTRSHAIEAEVEVGCEGIKPGWTRVNFNYFLNDTVCDYLIATVHLIADQGWKLLPDYRFEPETGLWRHRDGAVQPPLRLHDLHYDTDGVLQFTATHRNAPETMLATKLTEARTLLAARPDQPDWAGHGVGRSELAADVSQSAAYTELPVRRWPPAGARPRAHSCGSCAGERSH